MSPPTVATILAWSCIGQDLDRLMTIGRKAMTVRQRLSPRCKRESNSRISDETFSGRFNVSTGVD